MTQQGFYVGIDMDDKHAVVSFYEDGMKEPATVSMQSEAEVFQIPLQLKRKKEDGTWGIGTEELDETISCDTLKKVLGYIGGPGGAVLIRGLAFSVEKLDEQLVKLLWSVGEALGVKKEQIVLLDRKSAFYYFALSQPRELWAQEVSLFDYKEDGIHCFCLERHRNTIPQLVTIKEQSFERTGDNWDEDFYRVLEQVFHGRMISAVYLVGNGFDGGWMKKSLEYMCRGRRAFAGKNLYAKGACYALLVIKDKKPWPYAYIGDNEMKVNVSLAVRNRGKKDFVTLISAGDNWYESSGECDVILDDTKEIAIWLQAPDSRTANVEKLTLSDLPERENRTTRLRIKVIPLSDKQVKVEMKDMGFGEIAKPKEKHWEYIMSI